MKKLPLQTSIKINIPLQILVVEKSLTGMDIKKGSHIYCGSCGHTIGLATKDMELPMPHDKFLKGLTGVKVQLVNSTYPCLYHTCGKFLFSDKASWVFIGYDEWKRQTDEMTVEIVKKAIGNNSTQVLKS